MLSYVAVFKAIYSASVEEQAIVFYSLVDQFIGALPIQEIYT